MEEFRRALHWVFKVGNLKSSIEFYEKVLGMKVLRHEEFGSGCEATCNGPYAGAWSKTMIGYGAEKENFVFELTYNYGIEHYEFGNDLQYISVCCGEGEREKGELNIFEKAKKLGYEVFVSQDDGRTSFIRDPDGYLFRVSNQQSPSPSPSVVAVALRVGDLKRAKDYYERVLKMSPFTSDSDALLINSNPNQVLGFGEDQTKLQLVQLQDGKKVDHGKASGRIAFATGAGVKPIFERVINENNVVLTPPLTLPTPGKADVVVTILIDRDGYEICFVEEVGFYQLAVPTYEKINWEARASRGGDGNPLPSSSFPQRNTTGNKNIKAVVDQKEFTQILQSPSLPIVIEFSAVWCKKFKEIFPEVEKMASEFSKTVSFFSVDLDASEEIAMEWGITKVPTFLFFNAKGEKVSSYSGTEKEKIIERIKSSCEGQK